MSHTFYDSPDDASHPHISIDVTPDFVWFFQHTAPSGSVIDTPPHVRVRRDQLPAIHRALTEYLES